VLSDLIPTITTCFFGKEKFFTKKIDLVNIKELKMQVISLLAFSLGRRDEEPNIKLAEKISAAKDKNAVKELIDLLHHKNKNIQSDAVKVLDEIALRDGDLPAPYIDTLCELLTSKNNRLQWGAMAVLDGIADVAPKRIHMKLALMAQAADTGSVITRDRFFSILVKLAAHRSFAEDAKPLILEQLMSSPVNQLPMYAENSLAVFTGNELQKFEKILRERFNDFEKDSQKKRILKLLAKLHK
jgi:hypothetical protein